MKIKAFQTIVFLFSSIAAFPQKKNPEVSAFTKDPIAPIGIVNNISDSALPDIVQRKTFRYFWHCALPINDIASERDNTVNAEYYLDFRNEADARS